MILRGRSSNGQFQTRLKRGIASLLEYTPVSRIIPLTAGHIRPSSERVWPAWQEGRPAPSVSQSVPTESTRYVPALPRKPLGSVARLVRSPSLRSTASSPLSLDTVLSLPVTSKFTLKALSRHLSAQPCDAILLKDRLFPSASSPTTIPNDSPQFYLLAGVLGAHYIHSGSTKSFWEFVKQYTTVSSSPPSATLPWKCWIDTVLKHKTLSIDEKVTQLTALIEASQSKSAQTGYAVVSLHFEKIPQITEIDKAEEKALNIFAGAARMYSTLKADFPTSRPPLKVLKSMSRVALGMPSLFPAQRENIYNEIFSVFSPKEPIKGLNGILADWVSSQFLLPGYSTASVEECFQKLKAWGRLDSARIQRALTKATLASTKTFDRTAFKNATALIHRLKTMGVPVKPQTYHTLFQAALELNLTSSAQWAAAELYEMGAELPLPLYREWITKALAEETPHQTLVATKHGWTLSAPLFSHTPSRLSWKALSALTFAAARTQNVKLLESLKEEWVLRSKSASKKWKRVSERMTIHVADTK